MSTDDSRADGSRELTEEEFDERLQELREFDLRPVTDRVREKRGYENAEELEMKFRRFAKLLLEQPDTEFGLSADLDEYWHAFILDTARYHRFCEAVFGGYLHHVPGDPLERDAEAYVEGIGNDRDGSTDG